MTAFDWQRMLLDDFPVVFLGEVAFRALFAFVVVFAFLKVSGRRGYALAFLWWLHKEFSFQSCSLTQ